MTDPTFPFGYARPPNGGPQGMGTMLTWAQMLTQTTVANLHPEVLRRFGALIHVGAAAGVPLGVGTGWRVQPNPPPAGFASPGNSWHESCPVSPTSTTALAIDTVPNVSWPWMYDNAGRFGLRTFKYVGNEPWHVQPAEIPTSRKFATELPALTVWTLPSAPPPITPPPPTGECYLVNGYRLTVEQGTQGRMAKMCQQQINLIAGQGIVEDGDFGQQSVAALKNVQTVLGVTVDGQCGPKTWQAFEDGIRHQADAGDWD